MRTQDQGDESLIVYVGCYTTPDRNGHGEGIAAYRMDPSSGDWQPLGVLARVANPSFLALHPSERFLSCVHGGELSEVSAFTVSDGGTELTQLGCVSSGGANPVHLDVHPGGRWLVVANYTGGSIAVLPLRADGSLEKASHLVALTGECGPDPVEQSKPHPHDIPLDPTGAFAAVPDKGLDRVFIFRLDTAKGRYEAASPPSVACAPGAGPRHIAFHPTRTWAYVINELNSTITTYTYSKGGDNIQPIQTIPSIPADFAEKNTGSEVVIHPNGRFVYVSNRGHNSVGAFSIDERQGKVQPIGWFACGGDTPRAIALDPTGRFLYSANQGSDTIVGFRVNQDTGELTETGLVILTGSPSTMVFARGHNS